MSGMSTDTSVSQRNHNLNKRVNAEGGGSTATYPRKAFKVVTTTPGTDAAGSRELDLDFSTPFRQSFKYSTPSTGRTLTPCTPKLSGRRDLVHRLRQQLKNRDEMIMQMQTQILDQSRVLQMHQLRIGDLELLLTAANRSLFVAEQETDRLRKVLEDSCSCRPSSCQVRKLGGVFDSQIEVRVSRAQKELILENQQRDIRDLVAEARRLTEKLKVAAKNRRDNVRDYEKRVEAVRSELLEARNLASNNANLFEACDKERAKLSGTLTKLQQRLESQAIKLEHRRASRFSELCADRAVCNQGQESENTIDACAPPGCSSASRSSIRTELSSDYAAECRSPPTHPNWDEDLSQLSFEMKRVAMEDNEQERESPGSPEVYVRSRRRNGASSENANGSFKRFVFDMDRDGGGGGGGVVMLNHTDESYCGTSRFPAAAGRDSTTSLSPFSKMMSKLDLLQQSPAASLTDSLIVAEKIERNIGSVDLAFDRILDINTLDDMVRVCSPPRE